MEIQLDSLAHGGEAVGRLPDGRACFVAGGLPGERVEISVIEDRPRYARARLLHVLAASADRVEPPCPLYGRCGGCDFQHVAAAAQPRLKNQVLREQLQRLGKIADPPLSEPVALPVEGYRARARFAIGAGGEMGFRRHRSHEVEPVSDCLLLDKKAQQSLDELQGGWQDTAEVSIHAGIEGVTVTADGRLLSGEPAVSRRVGPHEFRVSADSFFQASKAGAKSLVSLVREAAALVPGERVLDLYSGVGLFARFLAEDGAHVTAVESHPAAARDAAVNLAGTGARIVEETADVALQSELHYDVIVLDPPRQGAGPEVCQLMAAHEPRAIVYVSCDPATLARDARTLGELGYDLAHAVLVDQFGHTHHIETVATFLPA